MAQSGRVLRPKVSAAAPLLSHTLSGTTLPLCHPGTLAAHWPPLALPRHVQTFLHVYLAFLQYVKRWLVVTIVCVCAGL